MLWFLNPKLIRSSFLLTPISTSEDGENIIESGNLYRQRNSLYSLKFLGNLNYWDLIKFGHKQKLSPLLKLKLRKW